MNSSRSSGETPRGSGATEPNDRPLTGTTPPYSSPTPSPELVAECREWLDWWFGHGKWTANTAHVLAAFVEREREEAVAAERERCARIAEYSINDQRDRNKTVQRIMDASYGQHVNATPKTPAATPYAGGFDITSEGRRVAKDPEAFAHSLVQSGVEQGLIAPAASAPTGAGIPYTMGDPGYGEPSPAPGWLPRVSESNLRDLENFTPHEEHGDPGWITIRKRWLSDVCDDLRDCRAKLAAATRERDEAREHLKNVLRSIEIADEGENINGWDAVRKARKLLAAAPDPAGGKP